MNASSKSNPLREEIGFLGTILGETIRESSGEAAFELVEALRVAARNRRAGQSDADAEIKQLVSGMDENQLRVATRAFTVFLDLLNLVEDRRRIRVLDVRAREAYPNPRKESIREAVASLKESGVTTSEMQSLVNQLQIELVFTAHPTEAKRRSIRGKLKMIRNLMGQYLADPLPEDKDAIERRIRSEIAKLWQTDFIRPWRPSVMQEVGRGLSIKPVLWNTIPRIQRDLTAALKEEYGESVSVVRPFLTFGSWIGGDRDGHPGVTSDVTKETLGWLRREAIQFHLQACDELSESLSMSGRQLHDDDPFAERVESLKQQWPELDERLRVVPPGERFRRWLKVIRFRLEQSMSRGLDAADNTSQQSSAYSSACELAEDVAELAAAVKTIAGHNHTLLEIQAWQTQINTFGLHLARLDVRQNAKIHREVLEEVLAQAGICGDYTTLDEEARCKLLAETLDRRIKVDEDALSEMTRETWRTFCTLHEVIGQYTRAAMGVYVISMTSAASDVLTVLWLWNQTAPSDETRELAPPIAPLLETIDDLKHGPSILEGMLSIDAYREHLKRHGDQQLIMLGYSDSTKDGGYLSACWSLYQAQQRLSQMARQHGIELSYFHGRGGSLGRGGGPAARSIMSLPESTFHGRLRLTEQGEVLADRYDDPTIAYRHLEQVIWSSLLSAHSSSKRPDEQWLTTIDRLANESYKTYRELLETPGFVEFFRCATPISEIEQLPIGSRPSRRKPDGGLADLRAIPWVFSWTQSRCLLPAWYGIGSAMGKCVDDEEERQELRSMYENWPFFRALIDNAELALAKSDLQIADEYAALTEGKEALEPIRNAVSHEYREAVRVVLALTGQEELLDGTPWLKEAIRVRNRYIDPLNLIQVELLRQGHAAKEMSDQNQQDLRHLTRLSINGIAAGMRTSG
ncbi:MAG: phosphoenolpyruvate carboxylase [Planctomycetota bacterium]